MTKVKQLISQEKFFQEFFHRGFPVVIWLLSIIAEDLSQGKDFPIRLINLEKVVNSSHCEILHLIQTADKIRHEHRS